MLLHKEVKGLSVQESEATVVTRTSANLDDGSMGWRVVHLRTGLALPMRFLREADALMAMHAISDIVDWSQSIEEILEAVDAQTIRKAMTEALAW